MPNQTAAPEGVQVVGALTAEDARIIHTESLSFLASLHRQFNGRRLALLAKRKERDAALRNGEYPRFLEETAHVRGDASWKVAPTPADLQDRRVEITGPVDAKMVINALNSGANVFMADFEDASAPVWRNMLDGQRNLFDAVRHQLAFEAQGKTYKLNPTVATLLVRPRGWHLPEKHVLIDGEPMSGSLFDFGLYAFHNAAERARRGTAPYFYLPKLESHLEARLWNDVFNATQDALGVPRGSFRATVLIETILAAFEMDEILYELRDHAAGLNAGRWDYIFSIIKKFRHDPAFILPDRAQVTMTAPFMNAYADLLIRTCHRRGAHAIGGMAAFIPSRSDAAVNATAISKVQADKQREVSNGCDGTWVAHPDLVPIARAAFDAVLQGQPHQKHSRLSDPPPAEAPALLTDMRLPGSSISSEGARLNINITILYMAHWLQGRGAVALHNLMEDAATAEISRAQLWQWLHHEVRLADGSPFTADVYKALRIEELDKILKNNLVSSDAATAAAGLLDDLVLRDDFDDFLTLSAYDLLD